MGLHVDSLVTGSLVSLPAMQETWVPSQGREDPLEEGKAAHSSILAWRRPWGHKQLDMTEQLSVVKNPAANAGDMSSIPAAGQSHRPRANQT